MLKELIVNKIKEMNKPIVLSGHNFILTSCFNPNHNDKNPSFSINLETGVGRCFGCGYKLDSKFWLYDVEDEEVIDSLQRKALYDKVEQLFKKPETKKSETLFPPQSNQELKDSWRGIKVETLKKYELYYCDFGHYEGRIIFPMWSYDGTRVSFNSRAIGHIKEGMQKYKYSKGIDVQTLVYPPVEPNTTSLVLCEGIMDALSLVQDGIPAIMNFGVNFTFGNEKIAHLLAQGVETIYLMFDEDKAGQSAVIKYIHSELPNYFNIRHARLCPQLKEFYDSGCKDYNEFLTRREYV